MKKAIIFILALLPFFTYAAELNEIEGRNYLYITDLNKEEIKDVITFSENLNKELESQIKASDRTVISKIVILKDKDSFNNYLNDMEIPLRDDYTYAMFKDSDRNRLIMYLGYNNMYVSLAHHLTLQYLDNNLQDSPQWLKLGLATYYEDFTTAGNINRNNKWISNLKLRSSDYFKDLISDTTESKQDLAWLLTDYLYNSGDIEAKRLLWDTVGYIKWSPDKDKNEVITANFIDFKINSKLNEYIKNLMGYKEYMDQGIKNYTDKKYAKSIISFQEAIKKEDKNYSPYYYLGLAYNKTKEYAKAYSNFSIAIDKGAPKDITYYSIGLNFYSSKDFKQALKYLNKVKDIKNSIYNQKAIDVINEIEKY